MLPKFRCGSCDYNELMHDEFRLHFHHGFSLLHLYDYQAFTLGFCMANGLMWWHPVWEKTVDLRFMALGTKIAYTDNG